MARSLPAVLGSTPLAGFLERPTSLDDTAQAYLIERLEAEDLSGFADAAARIIAGSSDVFRLCAYLFTICEARGIRSTILDDQVSARLVRMSVLGWLDVCDPNLLDFAERLAHDPELREEIARAERIDWYARYAPLIALEEHISRALDVESAVEEYSARIASLKADGILDEKRFEQLIEKIREWTTITRGEGAIGSLISEALQGRLGFATIHPHVTITSRASELPLR